MWNPPPNVTRHQGDPLAPDDDFFADPPADIGPIRTAHTTLERGKSPKSVLVRMAIALACAVAVELAVLALDQITGFPSNKLQGSTDPPVALVPIPLALIAAILAWIMTRFTHTCNYVGADGCAQFVCKRARSNITHRSAFHFKNASWLVTKFTDRYRKTTYISTSYGFFWYSPRLAQPVYGLKGRHTSRLASPPPDHPFHFCRSVESAWYHHLGALMETELTQTGRLTFYTGNNGSTVLGPGFIEITDRDGKVTRFAASEIGTASTLNHILRIYRPGIFFNPLDFSPREGVHRFDLTAHNLPMFRHFFKKCLGVDI